MEVIKTRLISFIWSFAEATFFFFVPDIWLGHITIKNPKEAYKNIPVALTGALCGGICIYFLGRYMFEDIENIMVQIPAITQDMSTEVGEEIGNGNILLSTIIAGLTGIPYKLYALWAGLLEVSLVLFLTISVIARGLRFLIVTTLTHIFSKILKSYISHQHVLGIYFLFWGVFYTFYFFAF